MFHQFLKGRLLGRMSRLLCNVVISLLDTWQRVLYLLKVLNLPAGIDVPSCKPTCAEPLILA